MYNSFFKINVRRIFALKEQRSAVVCLCINWYRVEWTAKAFQPTSESLYYSDRWGFAEKQMMPDITSVVNVHTNVYTHHKPYLFSEWKKSSTPAFILARYNSATLCITRCRDSNILFFQAF